MHEIYRSIAADINRDRMREAAAWRLARDVRQNVPRVSFAGRVRGAVVRFAGQPTPAPALKADNAPCG